MQHAWATKQSAALVRPGCRRQRRLEPGQEWLARELPGAWEWTCKPVRPVVALAGFELAGPEAVAFAVAAAFAAGHAGRSVRAVVVAAEWAPPVAALQ